MISEKLKFDLQGYIENAVQCSGHGTYMCGICACAPDFFGRRCECDAENMNFGGDLVSYVPDCTHKFSFATVKTPMLCQSFPFKRAPIHVMS